MVAGLSSRFKGEIKQFAPVGVNRESFIECSLKQAMKAKFNRIFFIVGYKTEKQFKEKFGNSYKGVPITYVLQIYDEKTRDKPRGTVDALCSAIDVIKTPFVVCTGDDLYGKNSFKILAEHLRKYQEEATIGHRLKNVLPPKGDVNRAMFEIDGDWLTEIGNVFSASKDNSISKQKGNKFACMTIFALHPRTIRMLNELLVEFKEKNKGDRTKEYLLHLALSELIKTNKMKMYPTVDKWVGLTYPEDEKLVKEFIANENPE